MATQDVPPRIPIRDLVRYYLRLGLLGFGGPVALVGQMERELVGPVPGGRGGQGRQQPQPAHLAVSVTHATLAGDRYV